MKSKMTKFLPVLKRPLLYFFKRGIKDTGKQKQNRLLCMAERAWRRSFDFPELRLLASEASPLRSVSQTVLLRLLVHTNSMAPKTGGKHLLNSQRILVKVILSGIRSQTDLASDLNRAQAEPVLTQVTNHDQDLVSLSLTANKQRIAGSETG